MTINYGEGKFEHHQANNIDGSYLMEVVKLNVQAVSERDVRCIGESLPLRALLARPLALCP